MLTTLRIVPLLVLPLIFFAIVATGSGGNDWTLVVPFTWNMFSGVQWGASYGDFFVLASLAILFLEIVKSVNTGAKEIINHILSTLVLIACILLFVVVPQFTNSAFLVLTGMAFIDVVAGFIITIVAARRDIGTGH